MKLQLIKNESEVVREIDLSEGGSFEPFKVEIEKTEGDCAREVANDSITEGGDGHSDVA